MRIKHSCVQNLLPLDPRKKCRVHIRKVLGRMINSLDNSQRAQSISYAAAWRQCVNNPAAVGQKWSRARHKCRCWSARANGSGWERARIGNSLDRRAVRVLVTRVYYRSIDTPELALEWWVQIEPARDLECTVMCKLRLSQTHYSIRIAL